MEGVSKAMKRWIFYLMIVLFSVLYIVVGHQVATQGAPLLGGDTSVRTERVRVLEICSQTQKEYTIDPTNPMVSTTTVFSGRILGGPNKGAEVYVTQTTDPVYAVQARPVQVGDTVLAMECDPFVYGTSYMFTEYARTDALLVLLIIFCGCLVLFGRWQGLNTIVSLAFTCLAIFAVFLPAALNGQDMYLWSIITCAYVVGMTLLIVHGPNKKSLASACGCISGLMMAGLMTVGMDVVLGLTGMVDEDSVYLLMLRPDAPIDLHAIVFATVLIGAMGAIMDVSMSIAAPLAELHDTQPGITGRELFRFGITIGRDIMGTMGNTLVLAYIGSSLSLTMLLVAYGNSLLGLLNREMIVVEILQALVGSFAILLTIPLTSAICMFLFGSERAHLFKPKKRNEWHSMEQDYPLQSFSHAKEGQDLEKEQEKIGR